MEQKARLHVQILLKRSTIAEFKVKIKKKDYNNMTEFFREVVRDVLNE